MYIYVYMDEVNAGATGKAAATACSRISGPLKCREYISTDSTA